MKLENITVGMRLAVGFSFALLMLILVAGLSAWRLHMLKASVESMVNQVMVKERLISEWAVNTNLNGSRTFLVLEMDDATRQAEVQKRIKETTGRITEIQKSLDSFDKNDEEKEFLAQIARKRSTYVALRDKIFKEKNTDAENARKLLWSELEPVLNDYVGSIRKLTEYHAAGIARMRNEVSDLIADSQRLLLILGVLAFLFCTTVATLVTRSIRRQLGGEPALAKDVANRIAQGDLAVDIDTRAGDTTSLMYAIKQMQASFSRIVAVVRHESDLLTAASKQIAAGNADLSARTEAQASALEQTASSMEELTTTVKHNADNAGQANRLAATASDVAVQGGKVVHDVVETMGSINDSAKKIVDIISVIDGIAFQTNILALNAAVEAARAGEQGKGFAVVASEVRSLAQRSAAAAKEIKALIDNSVEKVDAGSQLVDQAGVTMQEVVKSIRNVTEIVAEISAASKEQTVGIEQVNQAISQMDHVTQQNAALVEEAAASSEAMRELAEKLAHLVAVFRIGAEAQSVAEVETAMPVGALRTISGTR